MRVILKNQLQSLLNKNVEIRELTKEKAISELKKYPSSEIKLEIFQINEKPFFIEFRSKENKLEYLEKQDNENVFF